MKIVKYVFIFFCFILAIFGDIVDLAMKLIQITYFLTILGVIGSILIKLTIDIVINVLMFVSQIFDEDNLVKEKYSYGAIKDFLVKNRKLILNFLAGSLPEGASFVLGAGFGDFLPFRTFAVIVVFLLEIGFFKKFTDIFSFLKRKF